MQMDAHLGAHRTLSAWASDVSLASCLSPSGPPVHHQHQLGGAGALPPSTSLAVQYSALHMAAPSPRKAPEATAQPQGRRAQQLGAWDRAASFSLLVELVFLYLLLSRLHAPWVRKPKELSL